MLQLNGVYRHAVAHQLPDGSFELVERIVRVQEISQYGGDFAFIVPATLNYFPPQWLEDAEQVLEPLPTPYAYMHRDGLVAFV
jgi:hypothetical protein